MKKTAFIILLLVSLSAFGQVISGQTLAQSFTTLRGDGTAATVDSGMAGVLDVDGVANGASVTITGGTAGLYKAAVTLPTLTAGQTIRLRATYVMDGIATSQDIMTAVADTKRVSDLVDAPDLTAEVAALPQNLTGIATSADVTASTSAIDGYITASQTALETAIGTPAQTTTVMSAQLIKEDIFTVTLSNGNHGEEWTLILDGTETTPAFSHDPSAATVQTALRAADGGGTAIVVTGDAGGPYRVVVTDETITLVEGTTTGDIHADVTQTQTAGAYTGQQIQNDIDLTLSKSEFNTDMAAFLASLISVGFATGADVTAAVDDLSTYLDEMGLATVANVTSATSAIGGYITAAQGVITGAITTAQGVITGAITTAQGIVTGAITSAVSTIGGYITAGTAEIVGHIADIGTDVWNTLLSVLDDSESTIGHKFYNFLVNGKQGGTGT